MEGNQCRAAVFSEVGKEMEVCKFPLPAKVEKGGGLCRVLLSTICGSDIHTTTGRRVEPTPLILGHEIVGEVVRLGDGLDRDGFGDSLSVGDRVSWTIMAACGSCFYCTRDLPQKCTSLKKYGHTNHDNPELNSGLLGGYADYVYILPGTTVFKVPRDLPDQVAAPANCALSTAVNAVETIGVRTDDVVVIQGAGLLGLNTCALCAEAGTKAIMVVDVLGRRLEMARRFGATLTFNSADAPVSELQKLVRSRSEGRGADVVFEMSGASEVTSYAADLMRIGGRYLIAGLVAPGSSLQIDGNQVTRKYITIKGIHNYKPAHLGKALRFLEQTQDKFPFDELVGATFHLDQINSAFRAAAGGNYVRVGVRPVRNHHPR
jgi:alcohol dehydrogenase